MNYYIDVLKKYAVFDGRAARKEYWMFVLFNFIVSIILSIIDAIIFGSDTKILGGIYWLAVLLPAIGVGIRRMHDTNRSGWWSLIVLIPILGWIAFIFLAAQDSDPNANKYGPNPKGGVAQSPTQSQVPPAPTA